MPGPVSPHQSSVRSTSLRAASYDSIKAMESRNITIGVSQPDEVEAAMAWLENMIRPSQTKFAVKWVPVIMESLEVSYSELEPILTGSSKDVFPLDGQP